MHPIIFKIGPMSIYSYGVLLSVGFMVALILTALRRKEIGLSLDEIVDLCVYLLISGIIGARLLHVIVNFSYYIKDPLEIIKLHHGGLAYQGGLIFAVLAALWFFKKKRLPFLKTADYIIPYVALAQSIGRIGCFLNGCCYGKETNSSLGILLPYKDFPIHPTQIYYSVSLLVIFVFLNLLNTKKKFNGEILMLYFLLYSLMRFFIDFFRGDLSVIFLGLRLTQLISAIVIIIIVIFYRHLKVYGKERI